MTTFPSRFIRLIGAALVCVAATYALAAAPTLPAGVAAGASVEGIQEYTLKNGLVVLLFPDATKPTTTVNITYQVGSRHESYGETGMAHLLEHMLFKGTPSIRNVAQELARRGIQNNANTSFDRTSYHETFASSDASLDWVLAMEAARMTRSTFSKAELDTEMTVVRNEYEMGENDPRHALWTRMQSVAFDWHNYGHVTIGARSDIENVPFARLRAFYATHYQPDNAVLVVAGHFDARRALATIAREFGRIPRPVRARPSLHTVEPVQDGEREVTVRRPGGAQWVGALFHTVPGASPDAVALEALGEIMTVEPAGRLYKALVETGLATSVEAWSFDMHDPGFIVFWAKVAATGSLDAARDAMLRTLYDVAKSPIADAELERVRVQALKDFDETQADPGRFGMALSESIAQGDWRLLFLNRDRWRKVAPADVERVAASYLKPSNLTLGRFIPDATPDRAPAPEPVDVPATLKGYRGDAAVQAGESFDPTPANLESRTERFTLANGMKVALLSKKTRGATVNFDLELRYGDSRTLVDTGSAATLTAAMLDRGTTAHDRQAYSDALDKLHAEVGFGGSGAVASAHGRALRDTIVDTLRLVAEALQSPSFPETELETLKRESEVALEQGRNEPQAIAMRALARHGNPYPPGDIRYVPTLDEELARVRAVDIATIRAFHRRFYGASHAELAIVGDFDPTAVKAFLAERFGGFTNATPYERVPDPWRQTKSERLVFATPDKANAIALGSIAMPINDANPEFAALYVVGQLLGGGDNSRLFDRLREREGLSYSVGASIHPQSIDTNSQLLLYAIFAPQNEARVRQGFDEELARALRDGFTAPEVETAKTTILRDRQLARARDGVLASSLATQAFLGRTWNFSATMDAAIAAVTPQSAADALRKYVKLDAIAWAWAGDFAKGK